MLTAGDIQFEPQQSKIEGLTNSIVMMVAGDMATQVELVRAVKEDIAKELEKHPDRWLEVSFAARSYARHYTELRRQRAEQEILAPMGLTTDTFIERQGKMRTELARDLTKELLNFTELEVQAMFVGLDAMGAHIYVVDDGRLTCEDAVGFAAIGIGHWRANSHFMVAGHTKSRPFPETLYLTYSAKRRAEVAPGVGKATDMFTVGPILGRSAMLEPQVVETLRELYEVADAAIRNGMALAMENFNETILAGLAAVLEGTTEKAATDQTVEKGGIEGQTESHADPG